MTTRWFVENERKVQEHRAANEPSELDEELTPTDLDFVQEVQVWENVSSSVIAEVRALLSQEGIDLDDVVPDCRSELARAVHKAAVESEKRVTNYLSVATSMRLTRPYATSPRHRRCNALQNRPSPLVSSYIVLRPILLGRRCRPKPT